MAERFGEMFKRLRIQSGKTLRSFCLLHGLDPGNMSKMERGRLAPPESSDMLRQYAVWLGLEEGSDAWQGFFDAASAGRGSIPQDLLSDQELVDKLPVLFRMIRGTKANGESLDDLIERIRRA